MSNTNNAPVATIKGGNGIIGKVWKNENEKGTSYSLKVEKVKKDEEKNEFITYTSFYEDDMLRVAFVTTKAFEIIQDLKAKSE